MPAPAQNITSTTQLFLDIHDVTNNLVVMKDGTTSVIITINAMNFGLLAEEEQDGIIYAYAGLLNSLNYPIQIVIRSQTKDVTQYLTLLKEQEELAPNRLMQERIKTYRVFVSNLIHERNVLDKKFYVVIPASAIELGILAPQSVLPGSKPIDLHTIERSVILEKAKSILEPKRDHLIAQFARIGLVARELDTQEIIQLFYISYNPEAAEGQEITDSSSYTTPLVKAGVSTGTPAPQAVAQPPASTQPPITPAPQAVAQVTPTSQTSPPTAVVESPAPAQATSSTPTTPPAESQSAPVVPVVPSPLQTPPASAPAALAQASGMPASPQPPAQAQPTPVQATPTTPLPTPTSVPSTKSQDIYAAPETAPHSTTPQSTTPQSASPQSASPQSSELTPPLPASDTLPPVPEIT